MTILHDGSKPRISKDELAKTQHSVYSDGVLTRTHALQGAQWSLHRHHGKELAFDRDVPWVLWVLSDPPPMAILVKACAWVFLSHLLFCHSRSQPCHCSLSPEEPLTTKFPSASNTPATQTTFLLTHTSGWSPAEYFSSSWSCFQCFPVTEGHSRAGSGISKVLMRANVEWHLTHGWPRNRKPCHGRLCGQMSINLALSKMVVILEEAKNGKCMCV
jgi:hypothetical protein